MSAREERVRSLIEQDAADWFVASRAGLTARERNDFAAWLKASPLHVEEYLALEIIGRSLRDACKASQSTIDELAEQARPQKDTAVRPLWSGRAEDLRAPSPRWQAAAVAMAALVAVSIGLLVLWNLRPTAHVSTPAEATVLHFESRHGELQTHRLADNSVVHLNTDTAITVRYSKTERLVTLTSGEADFEVAHAPERRFRVVAGPAEAIALGTQFDVRLRPDSTVVTVVEGRVAVEPAPLAEGLIGSKPGQAPQSVELSPNQQVTISEGEWPVLPVTVDAERTTRWLHQQIAFSHEPLERVAAEFNRYVPKPIEITTPELRKLEITGVFATDDPRAFIAFLRSLEGVRVDETATRILVSKK